MSSNATYDDVVAASLRLAGVAHRTPVLHSRLVNELLGAEVFFKCENFQRVGAFKFRGAFNAISALSSEQRAKGVVAFSSGNHAQGIALAAKVLGVKATIAMPTDGPKSKIDATRAYGATIVNYDRFTESREEIAQRIADESGAALIPSFDYPPVIAGQDTAAKELFEEVPDLDALFVPISGGGLISGSILAASVLAPQCKLYGVEPEAANDAQQSLRKGERVRIDPPDTIADGATAQQIGVHTFDIMRKGVTDIVTASDNELIDAMRIFHDYMKMVVEPTGTLGLAGARNSPDLIEGRRIGVIITGGNVDMARACALLATNS